MKILYTVMIAVVLLGAIHIVAPGDAWSSGVSFNMSAPAPQSPVGELRGNQSGNPLFDNTTNLIIFVFFAGSFIALFFWLRSLPSEQQLKEQRMKKSKK